MNKLIFIYGTLKSGHGRNTVLRDQRYIGIARTTPNYGLYQFSGFPALITEAQATENNLTKNNVFGELYEVNMELLPEIDRIEATDRGLFERKEVHFDTITFTQLPIEDACWQNLTHKKAEAYFFKNAKLLQGANDCGMIWTR